MKKIATSLGLLGLSALFASACSGGGGGGSSQATPALYYACVARIKVGEAKYDLPNSCLYVKEPTLRAPTAPIEGPPGSKTLQLRGSCVCSKTQQEAVTLCNANNKALCDAGLKDLLDKEASSASNTPPLPNQLHCIAPVGPGGNEDGPIDAYATPQDCTTSDDSKIGTATSGLTVANGDYEAPLTDLPVTVQIKKEVVPEICVWPLPCTPSVDYDDDAKFYGSGVIRYSVVEDGQGNCPATGCDVRIHAFSLTAPGQSKTFEPPVGSNVTISNLEIRAIEAFNGKLLPDGTFNATGFVVANVTADGSPYAIRGDGVILHGTIDRTTGQMVLDEVVLSQGDKSDDSGQKTVIVEQLTANPGVHPPQARITAPNTVECVDPVATPVSLSATASTDPENDIALYQWLLPSGVKLGSTTSTDLAFGANQVGLLVNDTRLATGNAKKTIQVVDTTAPTLTLPQTSLYSVCDAGFETLVLTPPTATDGCTGVDRIYGQVTVGGSVVEFEADDPVVLDAGKYDVKWFATDTAGNVGSVTQSIIIAPAIAAYRELQVKDRAVLQVSTNAHPATVANAGTFLTEIGAEAQVGDLLSRANVKLRSRSKVLGDLTTQGTVEKQDQVVVSGVTRTNTAPALPTTMAVWASKPAVKGGYLNVNSGQTQALVPGAYGNLTIHPNAVVVLSAGRYTFDSVILDTGSRWQIPTGANVEIVITGSLTHRGNLVVSGGTNANVDFLVFGDSVWLGPSPLSNAWNGWSLLAPNALITIGTSTKLGIIGGKSIEVTPDKVLACVPAL